MDDNHQEITTAERGGLPDRQATMSEARLRPRSAKMVMESEEWLFTTLRSIGDAVIVTDSEGAVVFMNPVAETLTGWAEEEAIGRECLEIFHIVNEDTRLPTESPVSKVLRDGVISGLANHTILIARDGQERSIDDSGSPVRNGEGALTGVVLIFRDVSDKRTAERTIREHRDILQTLFDHIPILVAFMDGDGSFRWVNRELERVMGWSLVDLNKSGRVHSFHSDALLREAGSGMPNWTLPGWHDLKMQTREGEPLTVSWATVALSDGSVIGIGQVITGKAVNALLLEQKMRMLEQMNDRLKLGIVETHHRVKNNLQILSALVELQTEDDRDGAVEDGLKQLSQHIRSLASIHDLLTRETRTAAFTDMVSAKECIEELLPLLRATAGLEEIGSSLEDFTLPTRMGMSLAILVNELVTNSVKHGSQRVQLSLSLQSGYVSLAISDDGAGFPDHFLPGDETQGLGLSLVERVSRWDLRGETAYSNRPEGGACVMVTFPFAVVSRSSPISVSA